MGPHLTGTASGSSFRASFWLLGRERRRALGRVYDFCRATDDIVDGGGTPEEKTTRLADWRSELAAAGSGSSNHPVLAPLFETAVRFDIPFGHFFDLVKGVEMDLVTSRYPTFAQLKDYCELVASSVGLMCLGIFGRRNDRTEAYARHLGIALQVTNIIRDVGADARVGRVYLPQEDLGRFGCGDTDILEGKRPAGFGALMAFEAARAEDYYRAAEETLRPEDLPAMRPARVMAAIYRATLRKIAATGYNVFGGPVRLHRGVTLFIALRHGLPGILRPR